MSHTKNKIFCVLEHILTFQGVRSMALNRSSSKKSKVFPVHATKAQRGSSYDSTPSYTGNWSTLYLDCIMTTRNNQTTLCHSLSHRDFTELVHWLGGYLTAYCPHLDYSLLSKNLAYMVYIHCPICIIHHIHPSGKIIHYVKCQYFLLFLQG